MADLIQDTRLQFKRASSEYWATENPILMEGEPGYVTDEGIYKIGDGVTAWNDLPYEDNSGYNFVINGGFDVWQRGGSFSETVGRAGYTADRWKVDWNNNNDTALIPDASIGTFSVSRQTLEAEVMHDATPASEGGYEGQYFLRYDLSLGDANDWRRILRQPIEDVRTFSNQYVTMSFYARADVDSDPTNNASRELEFSLEQNFGSGGSSDPIETHRGIASLTTEWQRYSETFFMPSISDITIGSNSHVNVTIYFPLTNYDLATGYTIDIWGVMVEPSRTMSKTFRRNSLTIAGEIENCNRFYQESPGTLYYGATSINANSNWTYVQFPTVMRTTPTVTFPYFADASNSFAPLSGTPLSVNRNGFSLRVDSAVAAVGNNLRFQWTASAEI